MRDIYFGPKTTSLYAERCHGKFELSQCCQTVKNFPRVGDKLSIVELKPLMIEHNLFLLGLIGCPKTSV